MKLRMGYLVFGVSKPARWMDFCERMLGLPGPLANSDGSLGWRIDGAAQRLIVKEAADDDLLAVGIDCGDEAGLAAAVRRLEQAGVQVSEDAERAGARRVARLHVTADPVGNTVELFHGAEPAAEPFRSAAFPAGFRAGDLGFGHAVLVSHDLGAMEAFYGGLLGFGVTERLNTKVGPIDIRGVFMHCNARHHSLALFDLPSPKRLHHFMLQANDAMDVGRARERAAELGVPLALDLGQHPHPDGTFSFYGITPSGFDFEIGAGSGEIDPATWGTTRTAVTSTWGHRPQWRLKLRMARALVAHKLGRRRITAGTRR